MPLPFAAHPPVCARRLVPHGPGHACARTGLAITWILTCSEIARLAAAEEASRLKDEFLATLSHELRTPLKAILGWAHLLRAGSLAPDRAGQAVEIIARNANLQAQLIDDILEVSRIITGKFAIERVPVFIGPIVETVVSGLLPGAEARRIALAADVPGDLPPVEGDPKRLHQVLGNVVSNAIKFTPEGGRVDVRCRTDDGSIAIEVQDTGIGIEPGFLPYVFDRFRQGDSRSTRRHGGLGLGLAITRHVIEEHGGVTGSTAEATKLGDAYVQY